MELPEYCKNTQNLRCWDGLFYDCETNVGQLIYTHCPFGCDESGCLAGGGDRLIVHSQAPELHGEPRPEFPSDNVIPVCFLGAPLPLTWRLIRDEVVRTWGRRSLINFTGFGACDDDDAVDRIRIRFEENCRRRLVSELEVRFPNAREPEQNILGICRTYFDAHGELQTANDELLRFLTRHEFGHVLQLSDMPTLPPGVTVMTTGIRLSEVSALEISPEDLGALWGGPYILGKPPGSVVSPDGRCLSQSDGSTLKLATCSGAAEQFFQPLAGKVMHARSADSCLVHSALGDARIGSCAMPEAGWSLEHLTMSSLGRCLAPEGDDATLGTALAMERCQPAGSVAQSFAIDPYATVDGRIGPTAIAARIRHSQSGLCVAARGVSPGSLLVLESCADPGTKPTQIFRFETGGLIASGDLFVAWPREEGLASIEDGSTYNAAMHWVLSGAIESAEAMPSALTSGPDETVSLTSIEPLPYPEQQVFDLYY